MPSLPKKLRSRRGESLAEVLVAMLVVALAVLLLASMVTAAGGINAATRREDERFYAELSSAETAAAKRGDSGTAYQVRIMVVTPETAGDGSVTYTPVPDTAVTNVVVDVYGGDSMMTFKIKIP